MVNLPAIRWVGLCALSLALPASMAVAAELPARERAVAASALPYQPDPAINRLFTELWNLPEALVDGPVAALRKQGGTFQIQSDGLGLIVMAEGPAQLSAAIQLAVKNFAQGQVAPQMLPRAKAAVLKNDALRPMQPRELGEERLWELFYGKSTSSNALPVEDLNLLRLGAAEVKAFQEKLQQQAAIFYVDHEARVPSSFVPAQPQHQPGPAWVRVEAMRLTESRLLFGQPLPPLVALRHGPGEAWVASLRDQLADLDASVRLSFRPGSVLLILDLPLGEKSPEVLRQVVADRLNKIGAALPVAVADSVSVQPSVPSRAAHTLEAVRRQAEDHLLFGRTPAAMTERLWGEAWGLVLVPDAMRIVWLVPPGAA